MYFKWLKGSYLDISYKEIQVIMLRYDKCIMNIYGTQFSELTILILLISSELLLSIFYIYLFK